MLCTLNVSKSYRRNVGLNGALLLSLFENFKMSEAANTIRSCNRKYNRLCEPRILKPFISKENKISVIRPITSGSVGSNDNDLHVNHDLVKQTFSIEIESLYTAYIEYRKKGSLITLTHTYVPKELRGRGIGKILAKEALEYAIKNGLQLEIRCPYVLEYVKKYNPKYLKYLKK